MAGGMDLILGWGTKVLHAAPFVQPKKGKKGKTSGPPKVWDLVAGLHTVKRHESYMCCPSPPPPSQQGKLPLSNLSTWVKEQTLCLDYS